jgi:hypothetical protein
MWKNFWKNKLLLTRKILFESKMQSHLSNFSLLKIILVLTMLGLLPGCSKDEDNNSVGPGPSSSSQTIFPGVGGTVTFGSASVTIPVNALTDTTEITVAVAPNAPNYTTPPNTAQIGQIYAFTPAGLDFNIPVTVTMQYTNLELGPYIENNLTLLTYSEAGATPVTLANITRDPDNNQVSGTTTHFTYIMIGATLP